MSSPEDVFGRSRPASPRPGRDRDLRRRLLRHYASLHAAATTSQRPSGRPASARGIGSRSWSGTPPRSSSGPSAPPPSGRSSCPSTCASPPPSSARSSTTPPPPRGGARGFGRPRGLALRSEVDAPEVRWLGEGERGALGPRPAPAPRLPSSVTTRDPARSRTSTTPAARPAAPRASLDPRKRQPRAGGDERARPRRRRRVGPHHPMFHLADAWASLAITAVGGAHAFLPRFEARALG